MTIPSVTELSAAFEEVVIARTRALRDQSPDPNHADGSVTLTFPSQMNLEFDVLWTDDLSESQPWSFNAGPVTDTVGTGTLSFTDSGAIGEPTGYYQVRLK